MTRETFFFGTLRAVFVMKEPFQLTSITPSIFDFSPHIASYKVGRTHIKLAKCQLRLLLGHPEELQSVLHSNIYSIYKYERIISPFPELIFERYIKALGYGWEIPVVLLLSVAPMSLNMKRNICFRLHALLNHDKQVQFLMNETSVRTKVDG